MHNGIIDERLLQEVLAKYSDEEIENLSKKIGGILRFCSDNKAIFLDNKYDEAVVWSLTFIMGFRRSLYYRAKLKKQEE